MGYTHYWDLRRTIDPETWGFIKSDIGRMMQAAGVKVAGPSGALRSKVQFTDDLIAFNGVGDDSHESFIFEREASGFEFCKTAQKPYDVLVTAALLIIRRYVGSHWISISSDGERIDWLPAVRLCRKVFDRPSIERLAA